MENNVYRSETHHNLYARDRVCTHCVDTHVALDYATLYVLHLMHTVHIEPSKTHLVLYEVIYPAMGENREFYHTNIVSIFMISH